jgi:hypothetical protein
MASSASAEHDIAGNGDLVALLQDAIDIVEAAGDPDCEHWLGQARAALARAQS